MHPSSRLLIILIVGFWPLSAGLLIGAAVHFSVLPRTMIFPLILGIALVTYLGVVSSDAEEPEAEEGDDDFF